MSERAIIMAKLVLKKQFVSRFQMSDISENRIDQMIDDLFPILIDQILIARDERSQQSSHDSYPLHTAINIVIKCTLFSLSMVVFLDMKYTEIKDNTLTEWQMTVGRYEDFIECQETTLEDQFKEILSMVYRKNNYLLENGPDFKQECKDYILPFLPLFSGQLSKSSTKT